MPLQFQCNRPVQTAEIDHGLTLGISDNALASELGKIDQNCDGKISLEDFPLKNGETEDNRRNRMQEAVIQAMRASKIFKTETQYQRMIRFFPSFHQARKGLNTSQICPNPEQDLLFQTSTFEGLTQENYRGALSVKTLLSRGNIGLGTFHNLDGEGIVLGQSYYQITDDGTSQGHVRRAPEELTTPFAAVTRFEPDQIIRLQGSFSFDQLGEELKKRFPKEHQENIPYTFRITGTFSGVKTRSFRKQSEPYPPFEKVLENQKVFEFQNVKGTMVGFWSPDYMDGIQLKGFHFHFLTENHDGGSHVLEFQTSPAQEMKIEVDNTCNLYIDLSRNYSEAPPKKPSFLGRIPLPYFQLLEKIFGN